MNSVTTQDRQMLEDPQMPNDQQAPDGQAADSHEPKDQQALLAELGEKQAWLDAGLTEEETATLCRIAARVDSGLFETAGFSFHADTYQPGADGCCCLHVRPGK